MIDLVVKEEYVVCLQKPDGSFYYKCTRNKINMDIYDNISRKNWLMNEKTRSPFYTTGLYNQYDHKYIDSFIQYKLYLHDSDHPFDYK